MCSIFFVGNSYGDKLAGIEHALTNRLTLFNDNQFPAVGVFIKYNRFIHENAKKNNVFPHIFTMYDYFQESMEVPTQCTAKYYKFWQQDKDYELYPVKGSHDIRVYYQKKYRYYAHFRDSEFKQISYLNVFDQNRNKVKRLLWDSRGFISSIRILGTHQRIVAEYYYSPTGDLKMEIYRDKEGNIQLIMLPNYNATPRATPLLFSSEDELSAFFLDELNQKEKGKVIFFSDRNLQLAPIFSQMKTAKQVIAVLHSTHLKGIQPDIIQTPIKNTYAHVFDHLTDYACIVSSTKEQQKDIQVKTEGQIPVYAIPVGYVETKSIPKVPMSKRQPYKIISVARYSPEKQLHHQILAVKHLLPEYPELELHLFGFDHAGEKIKLEKLIAREKLENHVFIRGYLSDLSAEYQSAQLMLLTSRVEGFCLSLMEGLSQGVPAIAYDIKYGPRELIHHGENGYLIPLDDQEMLEHYMFDYFSKTHDRDVLSKQAYTLIQTEYNKSTTFNKWQDLLNELY